MTAVPLAWDAAVTLTASWQKVFSGDPKLGFFAQRDKFADAIDAGKVLPPAKNMDQMHTVVTNSTVDGVLSALFAILIVVVIVDAVRIWVKAIRAGGPADDRDAVRGVAAPRPGRAVRARRARRGDRGAMKLLAGIRWYLREVSGESAYERYVDHVRREHPGAPVLSRRAFERAPSGRARVTPAGALLLTQPASPFAVIERARWRALGGDGAALGYDELAGLSGLNEPVAPAEMSEIYVPLAQLLVLRVEARRRFSATQSEFLREPPDRVPFVIALGGSVAVGKSTAARLVVALLRGLRPQWRSELVTTDGFLLPNATLIERGILERKGFPESYDRRKLLRFVAALKSGVDSVERRCTRT